MLNILFQKLAFPQDLFRLDYISLRKCSVTFYSGLSGLLLGLILTVWGIYLFCGWDFFPWCVLTGHWPLYTYYFVYSLVQLLSRVQLFVTPWTAARKASLSITNSQSLLKLISIESVMPSNHLILCRPLLLLPSIFPSIRVFSNESVLHFRCPKYWSCSFNISLCNEHPGLISFRMDWLALLAVQGTLKSLLQHHSSKASTIPSTFLILIVFLDYFFEFSR